MRARVDTYVRGAHSSQACMTNVHPIVPGHVAEWFMLVFHALRSTLHRRALRPVRGCAERSAHTTIQHTHVVVRSCGCVVHDSIRSTIVQAHPERHPSATMQPCSCGSSACLAHITESADSMPRPLLKRCSNPSM
eukprot:6205190-Pleurochrysis_carterae.AAC.2